jgi:ferredoxin-NADP reductase
VARNVHEATVTDIAELTRDVVRMRFQLDPPEPLSFRPGQFVSLRVGEDEAGAAVLRSYSIASPPRRAEIDLVVKLVGGGAGSGWFAARRPGDRARFTGPMGFFVLDLAHSGDVVFGATGVGIAPVLPMLEELLERKESGHVRLFWGNRFPADLFWQEELAQLERAHPRFSAKFYLTQPEPDWSGGHGRISTPVIGELARLKAPVFYLVGSGAMIRELKAALIERGVDRKRQIRNEVFFE